MFFAMCWGANSVTTENRANSAGATPGSLFRTNASEFRIPSAGAPLGRLSPSARASHEPANDPSQAGGEIGVKERLSPELSYGSRTKTQCNGTAGNPVLCQTAVSETISTVRSPLLYPGRRGGAGS